MPDVSSSRYSPFSFPLSSRDGVVEPELAAPWSVEQCSPHKKNVVLSQNFVLPEHERPVVKHDEYSSIGLEIPVIDLSVLECSSDDAISTRKVLVSQVREACQAWGFFQVVNHGIPQILLERIQNQARQFFRLPFSEKLKVIKEPGKLTGYGHATVKKDDVRPWSEGFYLARDETVDAFSRRLWPHGNNHDFVDSYNEYDEKVEKLAKRLMDIIIEGLEVDSSHFEKYLEHSRGLLRWNHYPACPEPHKTLGLTPHTDFNLLTVLHHGDIGGLQVEKAGEWIAVRPRPDALAINIGDTFQVLTNGKYKSVPHRAVVNQAQARISLAYFFLPSPSVDIVASPAFINEENPALYRPFELETYTKVKQTQMLNTLDHFTIAQKSEAPTTIT